MFFGKKKLEKNLNKFVDNFELNTINFNNDKNKKEIYIKKLAKVVEDSLLKNGDNFQVNTNVIMPYIKNFVKDNNEKDILNKIKEIKIYGIEMVSKYNMINCFNKEFEIIENVCSYNLPILDAETIFKYHKLASPYVFDNGKEYHIWGEKPIGYNDLPPF